MFPGNPSSVSPWAVRHGSDEGHCHGEKWLSSAVARLLPVPALGWGTLGQRTVRLSFETGRKRGGGCMCPSVCLYLHVYSLTCTHPPSEKPLSSCLLRDCRVGDFSCSLLLYDERGAIMLFAGVCV